MGKWVHRISDVDPGSRGGVCSNCGPVGVRKNGNGGWKCAKGDNARKRKRDKRSRHHGLKRSQMDAMKDGASCAICGSAENLKIDHCHETGRIRGVLCHGCNVALGHMRDDPTRLRRAADYLEA